MAIKSVKGKKYEKLNYNNLLNSNLPNFSAMTCHICAVAKLCVIKIEICKMMLAQHQSSEPGQFALK